MALVTGDQAFLTIAKKGETQVQLVDGLANDNLATGGTLRTIPTASKENVDQNLGFNNYTLTFEVDENVNTHPLFWSNKTQQFDFTYGEFGNAAGDVKITGTGFLSKTNPIAADSANTYSCTVDVIGDVTTGVF